MIQDKLHLINSNGISILYYDPTMSIIPVDNVISNYTKKQCQLQANTVYAYNTKTIDRIIRNCKTPKIVENPISDLLNPDRIMLCVSNDCNLRCKYCYAQGGSYGASRSLMNIDTAKRFVGFCDKSFSSINRIVFFGGEPLLNPHVIEYVCKYITKVFTEKDKRIPTFSVITNGTIISPLIIKIIKEYISEITISIDGPANIHNKNRVYANGNGSYDKVVKFIEEIKKIKNLKIQYEATYTKDAMLENYDHPSINAYLEKTLGIKGVIVNDSHLGTEYEYQRLRAITKKQMIETEFKCLPAVFLDMLNLFVHHRTNTFCNMGYKNFSVSVNGDIFVCHLLNEKKGCSLGTIFGDNIFDNPHHFSHITYELNKHSQKCEACWCRNLCGGCTVECFYNGDKEKINETPMPDFCDRMKAYIEQLLILITQIRTDKELLQKFINKHN